MTNIKYLQSLKLNKTIRKKNVADKSVQKWLFSKLSKIGQMTYPCASCVQI